MPRLDNSSDDVIYAFDLDFDPQDPGATNLMDVCQDCYNEVCLESSEVTSHKFPTCEHPLYEEQIPQYTCCWCEERLEAYDN